MMGGVHFESGQVALFDHIEGEGPMWSGDGPRSVVSAIQFSGDFAKAPGVHVSICSVDAAHEQNLRLRLEATEISPKGFVVEAHTWGDTRIGRLSVSWLAVGSAPEPADDGVWDV